MPLITSKYSPSYLALLAILLLYGPTGYAQSEYGVEISLLQPTGRFGHVFKASPGIRVTRSFSDTDKDIQVRAFIGVHNFSPRRDTVNVGWYAGNNPYTNQFDNDVFIGSREIQKRNLYFTLGTQIMYRPVLYSVWRPYALLDLHGTTGFIDREILTARINSGESGGDVGVGLGGGGGIEYLTEGNFTFYLNIARYYNYSDLQGVFAYWNTALGATYLF